MQYLIGVLVIFSALLSFSACLNLNITEDKEKWQETERREEPEFYRINYTFGCQEKDRKGDRICPTAGVESGPKSGYGKKIAGIKSDDEVVELVTAGFESFFEVKSQPIKMSGRHLSRVPLYRISENGGQGFLIIEAKYSCVAVFSLGSLQTEFASHEQEFEEFWQKAHLTEDCKVYINNSWQRP